MGIILIPASREKEIHDDVREGLYEMIEIEDILIPMFLELETPESTLLGARGIKIAEEAECLPTITLDVII